MEKRKVNLLGTILIILLWFFAFILFIYVLDKLQNPDRINDYFNKVKNFNPESPQHPPKWEEINLDRKSYTKNYTLMIPGHEQVFDGLMVKLKPTYVKINSDGFRDREFSLEKPSNTFRIIMLGDSFTFGWGVELNDSLPKQLESILNSRQAKIDYEVLNFGASSQNTFGEVDLFKDKGLKYNPDLVIVCFELSDIEDELFRRGLYEKFKEEYRNKGLDPKEYSMDIHRKVLELQESKVKNTPFSETWKIVENPLEELVSILKQEHKNVLIYSLSAKWVRENEALNSFADRYEEVYFEHADTKINWGDESLVLHTLDTHPSPWAYKLHAEKIYKTLIKQNLIPLD